MDWPAAVFETLARLERRWVPPARPDPDFYGWEPWPTRDFFDAVNLAAGFTDGRRFLDVGCGIGTKLALMSAVGWTVAGIDWHRPYLDAARELVPEADLTLADVRDMEVFDADVVFMYRLAVDDAVNAEVEAHLIDGCPPGQILIVPWTATFAELGVEPVQTNVWRKP
jgi:SAM-dependent methyltransferase